MADHGLELYGNAIIVNTDFAQDNSQLVTGFLRAVAKGWSGAIEDPELAVKSMVQRNPAADPALETRRLKLAIAGNVLTLLISLVKIINLKTSQIFPPILLMHIYQKMVV